MSDSYDVALSGTDERSPSPQMSCRLRVDRDPGPPVIEALRQAGHDVDLVSVLPAADGALAEEVFASAGKAGRVLVTADPGLGAR